MDLSALDDANLIDLIANSYGKLDTKPILNEALSTLYDRYGRLVFSVALNLVGDIETSEEITQDVFVRICEGAHGYQKKTARVNTWLVSIARHRSIDELRRRSVRLLPSAVDLPDEEELAKNDGSYEVANIEHVVETNLQQQAIRQILGHLPDDQRNVLELAYFKGLSHSQIASHLNEPLGTIKSRIRLAMQKLRELLQDSKLVESTWK